MLKDCNIFRIHDNMLNLLIENYKPIIEQSLNTNINWKHIFYSSESNNKFIFIKYNEWSYLIWNNYDIHKTTNFIKDISKTLDTNVNYYFLDGQIDAARWIFSNKGEIVKGFCYQMGQIQYVLDYDQSEVDSIISENFCGFWDIYEETTQPIYKIKGNDFQIYYGQFK